jgi:hypothetical protein
VPIVTSDINSYHYTNRGESPVLFLSMAIQCTMPNIEILSQRTRLRCSPAAFLEPISEFCRLL